MPDTSPYLAALSALLTAFDEVGDEHDGEYRRRLATLGQHVRVSTPSGEIVGRAVDVLADGRLVVVRDDAGEQVTLATGDVIHLRPVAD